MYKKIMIPIVLGLGFTSVSYSSNEFDKRLEDEIIDGLRDVSVDSASEGTADSSSEVEIDPYNYEDRSVIAVRDSLHTFITNSKIIKLDNQGFQTVLAKLKKKQFEDYKKSVADNAEIRKSPKELKNDFEKLFIKGLNTPVDIEVNTGRAEDQAALADLDLGDDTIKTKTIDTVLLNVLMSQPGVRDLAKKVRTLIMAGADKNLHSIYLNDGKWKNQSRIPLKVAFEKVPQGVRWQVVDVLFDDEAVTKFNSKLVVPMEPTIKSIQYEYEGEKISNKSDILNQLIKQKDYKSFDRMLSYFEKHAVWLTEKRENEAESAPDQIWVPSLEKLLERMHELWGFARTTGPGGTMVDNIEQFFKIKEFKDQLSQMNYEARFNEDFQERLDLNFETKLEEIAGNIFKTKAPSEMEKCPSDPAKIKENLKKYVLEYSLLANFRNRIMSHLNRFALTSSNQQERSNTIRLVRYMNISDTKQAQRDREEMLSQVHTFGGSKAVWTGRNEWRWTPPMFAIFKKQSQDIMLYLYQSQHDILLKDGVGNNLLHLASLYSEKSLDLKPDADEETILESIGADTANEGYTQKTKDCVEAILDKKQKKMDTKIVTAALRESSALRFTPLSLAAAVGYVEVFESMKKYLIENKAWNYDDHSRLGTPLNILLIDGIKRHIEMKEALLAEEGKVKNTRKYQKEIDALREKLEEYEKKVKNKEEHAIRKAYDRDDLETEDLFQWIQDADDAVVQDYKDLDNTQRTYEIYKPRLVEAIKQIRKAPAKVVKHTVPVLEELSAKEIAKRKKLSSKIKRGFGKLFGRKSKENRAVNLVPQTVETKSPLAGLKYSTNFVKYSYLEPILESVVEDYLNETPEPHMMNLTDVYNAITDKESEMFRKKFNQSIEDMANSTIEDVVRRKGRLVERRTRTENSALYDSIGGDSGLEVQPRYVQEAPKDDILDDDF